MAAVGLRRALSLMLSVMESSVGELLVAAAEMVSERLLLLVVRLIGFLAVKTMVENEGRRREETTILILFLKRLLWWKKEWCMVFICVPDGIFLNG